MTNETIKEKVKDFVRNELKWAKKAKDFDDISIINCRAIAYGALQFTINLLPSEDYTELSTFWEGMHKEFTDLIGG